MARSKIKILNVLTIIEDGGMETLVSRIYKGLGYENFDFYICSLLSVRRNYLTDFFRSACRDVFFCNIKNKNLSLQDTLKIIAVIFRLAKYIKDKKIEVVHSHDFFSAFLVRLSVLVSRFILFHRLKANYVTLHNTLNWLSKSHNIINKLLSYSTDKIICVSNSVYEFSKQNDKISDSKYTVIYNGIDTEVFKNYYNKFRYLREELGFSDNDIILGNVSTFSVRKGHIYLLKAFKNLSDQFQNLKLLLVGSKREHETDVYDELEKFIDENNLRERIIISDTRDDIYKIYSILDFYVMPSIVEGFGLALAEAMSSELVCICSDIPAFRELIEDRRNGFLFETKNSDSLTNVIYEILIDDVVDLNQIRINARNTIIQKFSESKMLEKYYNLYKFF
ncbi:MAG: glycosyltransferase family 4 protein [Ignavibacteria bacterium]|nr:glycosyltransferase family 4 protein [Ignavibacteria bacterium]